MSKICQITGKRVITGNNVSHAKNATKRKFKPNLFDKKFYVSSEDKWIKLRVSAAGIRIIDKKGIEGALKFAKDKGLFS